VKTRFQNVAFKSDLHRYTEVENNQRKVPPGSIVMSLNGAPMELDTIDIFTLTDRVAAETRVAAKFKSIGLDSNSTRQLLRMQMASREGEAALLRLNLSDPAVPGLLSFVNNIETDRAFKSWSPALEQLLQPSGRQQLPPVRRNMYNIVAVLDMGQSYSWTLIDTFQQYIQAKVPLRFAYILVDNGVGGPDSGKKSKNPMAAMMGMPDEEDYGEEDYGDGGGGGGGGKKDPDLPEGVLIGTALARAGTLLLRRFNARAQGDFLKEVAATRPVIYPGNHFMPAVMGDATWAKAEKAFAKLFKRAFKNAAGTDAKPTDDDVKNALKAAVADILSSDSSESESAQYVEETKAALERKGASAPAALVNGLYFTRGDAHAMGGELDQVVMHFIQQETQTVTQAVYNGKLTDEMLDNDTPGGMYRWLHRAAVSKNTPFIVDQAKFPPKYVVMEAPAPAAAADAASDVAAAAADPTTKELSLVAYSYGGDAAALKGTTLWVVADAGTAEGAELVANAYAFVESDAASDVRVAVLHPPGAPPSPRARAVANAARFSSADKLAKAPAFIVALLSYPYDQRNTQEAAAGALAASGIGEFCDGAEVEVGAVDELLARQGDFAASKLGLKAAGAAAAKSPASPGAVVANGRAVEVPAGHAMDVEDFELLVAREMSARGEDVRAVIQAMADAAATAAANAASDSDRCMTAASLVATRQASATSRGQVQSLESLESKHSAVVVPGDGAVMLEAVLDPLSKEAQRIAPVLVLLRDALAPHLGVRVILNPRQALDDLPLKSYYRYAAPPAGANLELKPRVHFAQLPQHKTLTAHLDVPEMWLVTTAVAAYDLDNLKLEDLPEGQTTMHAEYRIEALLVTGHAHEVGAREPPAGTQLTLGAAGTVVMSNLGYFQLPAAPGAFSLALRPGRSSQIYAISRPVLDLHGGGGGGGGGGEEEEDESEGEDADGEVSSKPYAKPSSTEVLVASWQGRVVRLMLERRPGMEAEDVLDVEGGAPGGALPGGGGVGGGGEGGSGGIWGSIKSMFGSKQAAAAVVADADASDASDAASSSGVPANPKFKFSGETIHIFSVASGHLYERFLKIMMLSVRRNTNNPLKFWFIKNWLSPRFKDFLPHIAAEYGFDYELVTYKWPTWLHKQTEKQRIIWAYKLLFLDVLFPLTLNKVIFVDADQIIRADMKELWHMDLKGAPYAYTPFCDNNKEMEGYRFWKQGFWKSHLNGKPYHISALYVVDLARFRRTAAGDQLRVIYEQLSKDPNSLANLDQDLPNYAQHQVPIFSLPQTWLWCESWCGNQTKAAAKTIDLCNNPMTKEPKLKGAARIVKEWPALDAEVRGYTDAVEERLYGFKQVETPQEKAAREAAEAAAKEAALGDGDGGGAEGGDDDDETKAEL
jgi:UDP-glucose:glycoprotein glucosyltransferase